MKDSNKKMNCIAQLRNELPLGIHKHDGRVSFCVAFPDESCCQIKLYKQAETQPFLVEEMFCDEIEKGIFYIELPFEDVDGALYVYETSKGEVTDPYARRVSGRECFGKRECTEKAVVDFGEFEWQSDKLVERDFEDMFIYKLHVRGFTMHSSSRVKNKGTYLGVTQKCEYMRKLGINTVLLMPCTEFDELPSSETECIGEPADKRAENMKNAIKKYEDAPEKNQKVNYWGYGGEAFYFAPKASYASEPENACTEFKTMVKHLHKNGIAVFIDMDFGKLKSQSRMLEALRFWHREYHIDGFRINTAQLPVSLAASDERLYGAQFLASDFDAQSIYGANVPKKRRLAWFNDDFMITARRLIKGDEGMVSAFKDRIFANSEYAGRINYAANHDGFTLCDLYSYDVKHNEANGENNSDGTEFNFSWNCGMEGEIKSKKYCDLRLQMCKNIIAALMLSQGTPMLLAGDEFLNSQQGNNNAYCQDNETAWLKWKTDKNSKSMTEYVSMLAKLRFEHHVLHNSEVLSGMDYMYRGNPDISFHGVRPWSPDYSNYSRTLAVLINGNYARESAEESFYIVYNLHWERHEFDFPATDNVKHFKMLFTTVQGDVEYEDGQPFDAPARSVTVFMSEDKEGKENKEKIRKKK